MSEFREVEGGELTSAGRPVRVTGSGWAESGEGSSKHEAASPVELADLETDGGSDAESWQTRARDQFDPESSQKEFLEPSVGEGAEWVDVETARAEVDAAFDDHVDGLTSADAGPEGDRAEIHESIDSSRAHEASRLGEAEDYARTKLKIEYVDLTGFDQRTANETNATLEALTERYPEVDGLRNLSTMQTRDEEMVAANHPGVEPIREDTVAETMAGNAYAGIAINEAWADNFEAVRPRLNDEVATGHHPPGMESFRGVVTHEFGHLVYNHLRTAGLATEILDEVHRMSMADSTWINGNVSIYASVNEREFFAEAFAEYQLADKPREVAQRIGHSVDSYFERAPR